MSTEKMAAFIAEASYEQLPPDAIRNAKQAILDCLGVALAGCEDAGSKLVADYVREEGGKPEAGVVGAGFRAPASQAAWANGTMAHVLDYDDYSPPFLGHPTVAILPAVLALGEKHHVSGKEALLSYIIGFEAGANLGPLCFQHYFLGWHCTSTLGTIGAAAAASKVLKIGPEETRMVLGIAGSLAGGLKQNFGTMTKPLHAGNAARNGVIAATLAQKGFTADKSILESPQGFVKVFGGGRDVDTGKIGAGLGEQFQIASQLVIKPWPSCAGTHSSIEAALRLKEEHGIKTEEVEAVEIGSHPGIRTATIHSRPQTGLEAKFSNEYCISRALLDGEVGLKHFTDEMVQQREVQELVHKSEYVDQPEIAENPLLIQASEVVVKLRDGTVLSHRVDSPRGGAQNPLSWEDINTKFRDCASLALPAQEVENCVEMISNLESLPDIAPLIEVLAFRVECH